MSVSQRQRWPTVHCLMLCWGLEMQDRTWVQVRHLYQRQVVPSSLLEQDLLHNMPPGLLTHATGASFYPWFAIPFHARSGSHMRIAGFCMKVDPKTLGGLRLNFGAWPAKGLKTGSLSSHTVKADYRLGRATSFWVKGGHFQPTCLYVKSVRW